MLFLLGLPLIKSLGENRQEAQQMQENKEAILYDILQELQSKEIVSISENQISLLFENTDIPKELEEKLINDIRTISTPSDDIVTTSIKEYRNILQNSIPQRDFMLAKRYFYEYLEQKGIGLRASDQETTMKTRNQLLYILNKNSKNSLQTKGKIPYGKKSQGWQQRHRKQ